MSQYNLPCDCGAKIPVHRSQAGMSVTCDACQRTLTVPTIRGFQNLEPVLSANPAATQLGPDKPNILLRLLAGIFFLGAVASLGYGSYLAYQIYTFPMDMSGTKEEFLNDTVASFEALTPAEIWDTWNSIAYAGVDAVQTPEYFRVQYAYHDAMQQMYRYLGVGFAALLAFVICLAMTPRKRQSAL